MLTIIETQVIKIPVGQINMADRPYRIRAIQADKDDTLRSQLALLGQLHPVTLEETAPGQFMILDGHRRLEAVMALRAKEGGWEEVMAHVYTAGQLSLQDRFKLLREKNMFGENPLGLHERAVFFKLFSDRGMTLDEIAEICSIPIYDLNNHLKLVDVGPGFASQLNQTNISAFFAAILARRYQKWAQTPYAEHADAIAKGILEHTRSETLNLKSLNFYLNFYWGSERPFMAPQKSSP
ncbi:MAG: ParB N-terminal domain-containing protein [Elusimicrobia bacterium]|nr:ParB N-terminal domain-containing protein [Candidatus Obscuribacterium magneticum]